MLTIGGQRAAAHFMGSHFILISDPGAYTPGFMLPPASQAQTALCAKLAIGT